MQAPREDGRGEKRHRLPEKLVSYKEKFAQRASAFTVYLRHEHKYCRQHSDDENGKCIFSQLMFTAASAAAFSLCEA